MSFDLNKTFQLVFNSVSLDIVKLRNCLNVRMNVGTYQNVFASVLGQVLDLEQMQRYLNSLTIRQIVTSELSKSCIVIFMSRSLPQWLSLIVS